MLFGTRLIYWVPGPGAKLHCRICIQTVLRRIRTQKKPETDTENCNDNVTWKKTKEKRRSFVIWPREKTTKMFLMTQQLF